MSSPAEPFFSGPGLDRADALRADEGALQALADRDDARQLAWRDELPAIDETGALEWAAISDPAVFLGFGDGAPRFTALQSGAEGAWSAFPLLAALSADDAPVFAAAVSLTRWHLRHSHCANCGAGSDIARGGWSRRCPACGADHFPRVDPVVIMLAEHDGQVLLGRQPQYPVGRYSALAGFVEVGETIEAAVARELHEEAGIHAFDVTYVASQPWPFPSSLMIGCIARSASATLTVDRTELEDARWFSRDDVRAALAGDTARFQPPPRAAIARTLLEHWARLEEASG